MPSKTFNVILGNAEFPFNIQYAPQTVILQDLDTASRVPFRDFYGSNVPLIQPQALFMENVLPWDKGYKSVRYTQMLASTAYDSFSSIQIIRDSAENITLLAATKSDLNFIANSSTSFIWELTDDTVQLNSNKRVTRAYLDGRTILCYPGDGLFELDVDELVAVDIDNLPIADTAIDGVSSANGYLIVWDKLTVYWAPSSGGAFDFEPIVDGEATGAGNGIPEELKGLIRLVAPITGGFVIYSNVNAIGAQFTSGNLERPFIFREISNAGGIAFPEQVTTDSTMNVHFAWTTGGLQRLTVNSAEILSQECSDFIAGRFIERYNYSTHKIEPEPLFASFAVKLNYISNRFLTISYGLLNDQYEFILVYDFPTKRWGKLRVDHVDVFFWPYETGLGNYILGARQQFAIMGADGQCRIVIMDAGTIVDMPVTACLIFGKYQFSRSHAIELETVSVQGGIRENPNEGGNALYATPSYDGKTLADPIAMNLIASGADSFQYGLSAGATNWLLALEGTIDVIHVDITAQRGEAL